MTGRTRSGCWCPHTYKLLTRIGTSIEHPRGLSDQFQGVSRELTKATLSLTPSLILSSVSVLNRVNEASASRPMPSATPQPTTSRPVYTLWIIVRNNYAQTFPSVCPGSIPASVQTRQQAQLIPNSIEKKKEMFLSSADTAT